MKNSFDTTLKQGFIFALLATLALAILFFAYIFNGSSLDYMDFAGWTYFATSCLTHAWLFIFIPFFALFLPMEMMGLKRRYCNAVLTLVYSFLFILAVTNSYVFNIYHFHINGLILKFLTSPGASEIFVFSTAMKLKAATIAIGLVGLCIGLCWLSYFLSARLRIASFYRKALLPPFLIALTSQTMHIYGSATMKTSIVESTEVLPYYFPLRMNSLLTKLGIVDKNKLNQIRFQNSEAAVNYPLHPLTAEKPDSALNIVILCIDSWNPRTMTRECTPNIYKFAEQAEYYTKHISSSNATRGGIFGMFTGLSAYYWKSFEFANVQPIMIEELLRAGYTVQAYPSATLEYPPFAKLLFKNVKGLNTKTAGKTPYERDLQITRNFLSDLDKYDGRKPFFSFIFYDLAHAIEIPKSKLYRFQPSWETCDYMKLSNNTDPTPFFNLYKNCVAQVDSLVGLTLDKLKTKGLLHNTVVMITGDHGQEFNENHNNYWGHASNYSYWQTAVPMVYYYPSCKPTRQNYRTTHYDISPTLLHKVLGIKNPPTDYSMGKYLSDSSSRDWHLVGSDLYYAFIRSDGTIIEKRGAGNIKILDKHMRTIDEYPLDARKLNEVILDMNRFFKKKQK
ncbi:sulfatase-like hydrolase/transferase [Prevotella intermedia]|uniref:sulfatase-like hydrolase/transferase n=1 Tax=Prevotella intermedia TaxID=28131 RepID=UPI000BE72A2D|nr:sulfatase-like hydrolase/transferase [Prevotella intermedia]PDP68683.1 arylsulfatase [Prevotella intermedia]